ncbi:MAG: hypothetical protein JXO44_03020 [Clostridia bacterium]|nr:hypothetical protein [Clostridia bacterium]
MKKIWATLLMGMAMMTFTFATVEKTDVVVSSEEPYVIAAELKALEANDFVPPALPATAEDYAQIFLYMAMNDIFEYDIDLINARFDVAASTDYKSIINAGFHLAGNKYPEYMAFTNENNYRIASAGIGSKLTLNLSDDEFSQEEISLMRTLFKIRTDGYIAQLKSEGKLRDDMSEIVKAKVIYEWIVWHTQYDQELKHISSTGFGLYDNRLAICEGYTAAYNMMCRSLGIDIQAVTGFSKDNPNGIGHMWSMARLEGILVHIDSTWGDPVGENLPEDYINYNYFALEPKMMKADHIWDEAVYGQ